jgi:hypothetical protein
MWLLPSSSNLKPAAASVRMWLLPSSARIQVNCMSDVAAAKFFKSETCSCQCLDVAAAKFCKDSGKLHVRMWLLPSSSNLKPAAASVWMWLLSSFARIQVNFLS